MSAFAHRGSRLTNRCQRAMLVVSMSCVLGLAACGVQPDGQSMADKAELEEIRSYNVVPRSSPKTLITAFDRHCVSGPAEPRAFERHMRSAGYVPTKTELKGRPRVYVVDDKRPIVVRAEHMCIARAVARTGQTTALHEYIAREYPDAVLIGEKSTKVLGEDLETAWLIDGAQGWLLPRTRIIATQRTRESILKNNYDLVYFDYARGFST